LSGILFAAIIPLFSGDIFKYGLNVRHALWFNNPNQLSLFASLIMAFTIVLKKYYFSISTDRREKIFISFVFFTVFIIGHFYTIISASRAGFVCTFILDAIAVWVFYNRNIIGVTLIIITVFGLFIVTGIHQTKITKIIFQKNISNLSIYKRFSNVDLKQKLIDRTKVGFNFNNLDIIFGSGKTNKTQLDSKEAHNTFVDVLYSYGIIGGILFAIFIFTYLKSCYYNKFHMAVIMAFIPFHLSHNLIRFRLFWIFLALIYSINFLRSNNMCLTIKGHLKTKFSF
jgi:hypothetical protein